MGTLDSIPGTKNLVQGIGRRPPYVTIFLSSSLITIQTLFTLSHTVFAHEGGHNKLGRCGPALSGRGGVAGVLGTPLSHTCQRTKFGRSK